ncbi:MAG TPA: hypothetical protein PLV68_02505, partial [Ilumatobacteraceae bacterium]|nr:hypothetical protein [Ilumatobacteraceae bacterium]
GVVQAAIDDPTTHDDVRADHDAVVAHGAFGVPTIVFPNGRHVFGPVVAPAPTGQEALDLWDLTVAYTRVPYLYEIKTPKTDADMTHIATTFQPYLTGRDWESKQNPAP